MASAANAGKVQCPGNLPQSAAPVALLPYSGDNGLLRGVLGQEASVCRIGAPTKKATIFARHAPAVGLVLKHGRAGSVGNLLAIQLGESREQGEGEMTHRRARVDVLLNYFLTPLYGLPRAGRGSQPRARAGGFRPIQKLLSEVSDAGKVQVLADVLNRASKNMEVFQALIERAAKNPEAFAEATVALNLAAHRAAAFELDVVDPKNWTVE
jgi:hypothetical protein